MPLKEERERWSQRTYNAPKPTETEDVARTPTLQSYYKAR